MQKIKKLSPLEAQKIAAGEVVERPANIVKELIENALDAGATKISIIIKRGGQEEITISDNGCGMSPEDAYACFEHHATSKLVSVSDLDTINTFGFRGEALSSISAVSKVILQTKEASAQEAIILKRCNGEFDEPSWIPATTGTTITINDLFYNVPARKKFLKKDETETRAIIQLVQAACLDYLHVHFQLTCDGSMTYNCPSTTTLTNRMAQIFDHNLANSLIELPATMHDGVTIQGIISNAHVYRYNRNHIFLFVNNRWVKNHQLVKAILKGYMNMLPPDKYPIAALSLTVDPTTIDVNIHPRKEEILFTHPRRIETLISSTIKQSLEDYLARNLTAPQSQPKKESLHEYAAAESYATYTPSKAAMFSAPPLPTSTLLTQPMHYKAPTPEPLPDINAFQQTIMPQPAPHDESDELQESTILGVAHKTYLIVEHADGIFFVDQHAAHERILYEQFAQRFNAVATIQLLFPEIIELNAHDCALVLQHGEIFTRHGIGIEQCGQSQLMITSTPVHAKSVQWRPFILEILDTIKEHEHLDQEAFTKSVNHALQAQMACKAAVKAGDSLSSEQLRALIKDLQATPNRTTCPHGRPTGWLLPLYELEKKFKRKL